MGEEHLKDVFFGFHLICTRDRVSREPRWKIIHEVDDKFVGYVEEVYDKRDTCRACNSFAMTMSPSPLPLLPPQERESNSPYHLFRDVSSQTVINSC